MPIANVWVEYKILRYVDAFYLHGHSKKKMGCFLNSRLGGGAKNDRFTPNVYTTLGEGGGLANN